MSNSPNKIISPSPRGILRTPISNSFYPDDIVTLSDSPPITPAPLPEIISSPSQPSPKTLEKSIDRKEKKSSRKDGNKSIVEIATEEMNKQYSGRGDLDLDKKVRGEKKEVIQEKKRPRSPRDTTPIIIDGQIVDRNHIGRLNSRSQIPELTKHVLSPTISSTRPTEQTKRIVSPVISPILNGIKSENYRGKEERAGIMNGYKETMLEPIQLNPNPVIHINTILEPLWKQPEKLYPDKKITHNETIYRERPTRDETSDTSGKTIEKIEQLFGTNVYPNLDTRHEKRKSVKRDSKSNARAHEGRAREGDENIKNEDVMMMVNSMISKVARVQAISPRTTSKNTLDLPVSKIKYPSSRSLHPPFSKSKKIHKKITPTSSPIQFSKHIPDISSPLELVPSPISLLDTASSLQSIPSPNQQPTVIQPILPPVVQPTIIQPLSNIQQPLYSNIIQPTIVQQPPIIQQPVNPPIVQQPIQPAIIQQPIHPAIIQQPVQPAIVQQPIQPAIVQQLIQPAIIQQPVQPAIVQQLIQPAIVQQPIEAVVQSVVQPVVERVVEEERELTEEERDDLRLDLGFKFKHLARLYPELGVPKLTDYARVEDADKAYRKFYRQIGINSSVSTYKIYLLAGFAVLELIGTQGIGLQVGGFTLMQLKAMTRYEQLLIEMGEASNPTGGSEWPPWAQILVIVGTNFLALFGFNKLSAWLGPGIGGLLQSMLGDFLSGSHQDSRQTIDASQRVDQNAPNPVIPPTNSSFTLDGILRMFNGVGGSTAVQNVLNGGNQVPPNLQPPRPNPATTARSQARRQRVNRQPRFDH